VTDRTWFEKVLRVVSSSPGLDQDQLSRVLAIPRAQISYCTTNLERHQLLRHELQKVPGATIRHRVYIVTEQGEQLIKNAPSCQCGGAAVLNGFRGSSVVWRCVECGREIL